LTVGLQVEKIEEGIRGEGRGATIPHGSLGQYYTTTTIYS